MPSRLNFETLIPGTDEVIVFALIPNNEAMAVTLQPRGTVLTECRWVDRQGGSQFNSYILSQYERVRLDGGEYVRVNFCKDYSAINPATGAPYSQTPVQSIPSVGNHYWHPVLKALTIIPDDNSPRTYRSAGSTNSTLISGPSFYVREVYVPGATEGTRFVVDTFCSQNPFKISQKPTPQPASVSYDVPGKSGGFPECLHGGIEIPDLSTSSSKLILGDNGAPGTSSSASSGIEGQIFPATNFKRRAPYVLKDDQQFQSGVYVRTRVRVFPPPPSKTIVQ